MEAGFQLAEAQATGDDARASFFENKMHTISSQTGFELDYDGQTIKGIKPVAGAKQAVSGEQKTDEKKIPRLKTDENGNIIDTSLGALSTDTGRSDYGTSLTPQQGSNGLQMYPTIPPR